MSKTPPYSRAAELGFARATKYPLGEPLYHKMTKGRIAANAESARERKHPKVNVWPDDCECSANDRIDCAQGCKPVRHDIGCHAVRFKGQCDCGASGQPATRKRKKTARVDKHMRSVQLDMETASPMPLVKLMQGHSPAALAGIRNPQLEAYASGVFHNARVVPGMMIAGSLVGPTEYATGNLRPAAHALADYKVRNNAIYLRAFNVKVATFAENCAPLPEVLKVVFDAAHAGKQAKVEAFKRSKLPVDKQIMVRQAAERVMHNGWYTHGCGQWVHDNFSPCSVCKPIRKPRKKK